MCLSRACSSTQRLHLRMFSRSYILRLILARGLHCTGVCRIPNIVETARKSRGAGMIDGSSVCMAFPVSSKGLFSPWPDTCQPYPTLHLCML
ncbi:hypothetical protein ACQKWADRAFT_300156 [Trichoderma austrokoningii]